jgi:hypothetical protein
MGQVGTQTTIKRRRATKTEPEATALPAVVEDKGISKREKKQLFEAYEDASGEKVDAQDAFKKAEEKVSQIVREIHDKCGNGPFHWSGKIVTIASRNGKWFFRSKSDEDIEVIG